MFSLAICVCGTYVITIYATYNIYIHIDICLFAVWRRAREHFARFYECECEFSTEYGKTLLQIKEKHTRGRGEWEQRIGCGLSDWGLKGNCWLAFVLFRSRRRRRRCRSAWQKCQCECQEQKQKPRRPNQNVWNAFTKYKPPFHLRLCLWLWLCPCVSGTCGMPACRCVWLCLCLHLKSIKRCPVESSREEDKIVRDKCQRLWC